MAVTCPSCGMENSDSATECRRCRAAFADGDLSASLGVICQRCEAYNEPGVTRCTTCGYKLGSEEAPKPAAGRAPQAGAASQPLTPPATSDPTLSEELSGLALSAEEAADAGLQVTNGASAMPPPAPPPETAPHPASRPRGWAAVEAAMGGGSVREAPATPPPDAPPASAPEAPPAHKTCQSCAAENPPAAKFCSECGTPFGKAPLDARQPRTEQPPTVSVQMDEEPLEELPVDAGLAEPVPADEPLAEEAPETWAASTDPTAQPAYGATPETSPIDLQDPSPEPLGWEEPGESVPAEVPVDAAEVAEAFEDAPAAIADPLEDAAAPAAEPEPPYQASLVVERGSAAGTTYLLGHIENVVGAAGAAIELPDDPHLAPCHAAIVFDEQRLLVRDEGSANGVYLKVRESAAIEPGDSFVVGERLLRFDGACELPVGEPGETPYLGSPRPHGTVVRITEILRGGKTGRTCFRAGPAIAVGRTGCDVNFASDPQLAPRHAEVRIAPEGSATLVDLDSSPGGVFLRLRPQQSLELQPGDVLQLGDQLLRLEVG
ncbi:MAG TPA: FHA domain-containing protein [Myxococcales bacterium]|nr:FHA domain-containing protein [Myxococcales bacterium]